MKLSADAQKLQREVAVHEQDLTTIHVPLFSLIMRPPSYRQRLFVEHDLGESSGSTVDVARRAGYPWPEQMARKMLRDAVVRRREYSERLPPCRVCLPGSIMARVPKEAP